MRKQQLIAALLLSSALCMSAHAQGTSAPPQQQPDSVKGAVLKGKAPVNRAPLKVTLPRPVRATLDNGLKVILIEDHKQPTFTMQLALVGRGDADDPKGKDGVAYMTASLLREGTPTRSSVQFSQDLETLGGTFGVGTTTLDTYITMSGLTRSLDPLLAIVSDVILHPTFPSTELERFRPRLLSQLQAQRANPDFLVEEQFAKAIYGDHPAAVVSPSPEAIRAITQEDIKQFHETYYKPNESLLLVSGDLTLAELMPKLKSVFGGWARGDFPKLNLPPVSAPTQAHAFVVDRKASVQTSLLLGSLSIVGSSPDRYALAVMNQVLGGGPASRLFLNLREDKGYTYGASSSIGVGRYPGTFSASADVRTEVTEGALHEFLYELKRISKDDVGPEELENAKRAIVGRFALSLENPRSFLSNLFEQETLGLPDDYWDHYAERIAAVTPADIKRVAAKYVDPTKLQIVAVGDAEKIDAIVKAAAAQP
jgi:predicted Zn-dependent peptidase